MFDVAHYIPVPSFDPDVINVASLRTRLSRLSDDELSALEDDLDFCTFTGVPSARILDVLDLVTTLDEGWQRQRSKRINPSVPAPY